MAGARWTTAQYEARLNKALSARLDKKPSKYGNKPVMIDGIWFQSTLEGNRYTQLKWLQKAEVVTTFKRQVPFECIVNGVKIYTYKADFVVDWPDGRVTVEDTKGVETPVFRIAKKLVKACHGIDIVIIKKI
jgi:Protein of unknown function (DUF1064)